MGILANHLSDSKLAEIGESTQADRMCMVACTTATSFVEPNIRYRHCQPVSSLR